MKSYTPEERRGAKIKLPKPLSDFLGSDALLSIYVGIIQKNRLNIRQGALLTEIANVTLLGLEPESALETNLHQALPELSAETMRELVADLSDRVFKEARRRLEGNILEPEPEWDEEELGPKPASNNTSGRLLTDAELDALAEKEEKEGWKPPEEEEEVPQLTEPASNTITPTSNAGPEQTVSIVQEKLAGAAQKNALSVSLPLQEKNEPKPVEKPIAPAHVTPPIESAPITPPSPKLYKGKDPYREDITESF